MVYVRCASAPMVFTSLPSDSLNLPSLLLVTLALYALLLHPAPLPLLLAVVAATAAAAVATAAVVVGSATNYEMLLPIGSTAAVEVHLNAGVHTLVALLPLSSGHHLLLIITITIIITTIAHLPVVVLVVALYPPFVTLFLFLLLYRHCREQDQTASLAHPLPFTVANCMMVLLLWQQKLGRFFLDFD